VDVQDAAVVELEELVLATTDDARDAPPNDARDGFVG